MILFELVILRTGGRRASPALPGCSAPAGRTRGPTRTRLHALGTRAHAAARARRRQRRHGPSFPFRESPAYILCPCLVIYVTAPGPGPPEMAVARESEARSQRRHGYISGGDFRLGEPRCTLEKLGAAARGRCRRARASRPPNPRPRAKRRELGAGAPGFPASRARPNPARPRAPRRHRAMLHLSDFSGPDALLSKPTEGCAHASPELPRLPARDAPSAAAAAYPGGKERWLGARRRRTRRGVMGEARGVGVAGLGGPQERGTIPTPTKANRRLCGSPACCAPWGVRGGPSAAGSEVHEALCGWLAPGGLG